MPKYRYTNDAGEVLAHCPKCGNDLLAEGGIVLQTTDGAHTHDWPTRLDGDGVLVDVNALVERGMHSGTLCRRCHELLINLHDVNEDEQDEPERLSMTFNCQEAKGTIALVRHGYGADLLIDGVQVAFIDLFPQVEGDPPQLIIDGGPDEEPLAKVVVTKDSTAVIVHKDARQTHLDKWPAIHHGGDRVFVSEPEAGWQRVFRVAYRVEALTTRKTVAEGTLLIPAANEYEANQAANRWVHENDPYCDKRLQPLIHIDRCEVDEDSEVTVITKVD